MVKQGGVSWNNNIPSKSGVQTRYKCKHCGRDYKMEHNKDAHEKSCKTWRDSR